jgi:hypothetical protein
MNAKSPFGVPSSCPSSTEGRCECRFGIRSPSRGNVRTLIGLQLPTPRNADYFSFPPFGKAPTPGLCTTLSLQLCTPNSTNLSAPQCAQNPRKSAIIEDYRDLSAFVFSSTSASNRPLRPCANQPEGRAPASPKLLHQMGLAGWRPYSCKCPDVLDPRRFLHRLSRFVAPNSETQTRCKSPTLNLKKVEFPPQTFDLTRIAAIRSASVCQSIPESRSPCRALSRLTSPHTSRPNVDSHPRPSAPLAVLLPHSFQFRHSTFALGHSRTPGCTAKKYFP